MIGRDKFPVRAPDLGPQQKERLCQPLPLFMAVELLMHVTFVADEIRGSMDEPVRK